MRNVSSKAQSPQAVHISKLVKIAGIIISATPTKAKAVVLHAEVCITHLSVHCYV